MLLPPFIAASDFINMNGTIFCEYFLGFIIFFNGVRTDIVRGADDLPDLLVVLDHAGHLQVAQLDLAVRELAHQHDVLGLRRRLLINQISI